MRSGLLESDAILQRYCSTQQPAPILSEGNELYIKFHSDASLTDKGFSFNWHAVPAGLSAMPPNSQSLIGCDTSYRLTLH